MASRNQPGRISGTFRVQNVEVPGDWPGSFATLDDAIAHVESFVDWYNHEHHHTGIGLVTPADRHAGRGQAIDIARQATLDAAYDQHPERFGHGRPTPPNQPDRVWINPPTITSK